MRSQCIRADDNWLDDNDIDKHTHTHRQTVKSKTAQKASKLCSVYVNWKMAFASFVICWMCHMNYNRISWLAIFTKGSSFCCYCCCCLFLWAYTFTRMNFNDILFGRWLENCEKNHSNRISPMVYFIRKVNHQDDVPKSENRNLSQMHGWRDKNL